MVITHPERFQNLQIVFAGDQQYGGRKIVLSMPNGSPPVIEIIPVSGLFDDEAKKQLQDLLQRDVARLADNKLTRVVYWDLLDVRGNTPWDWLLHYVEKIYRRRMAQAGYQRRVADVLPVPDAITSVNPMSDLREANPSVYRKYLRYSFVTMIKYLWRPREATETELSDFRRRGTVFKKVTPQSVAVRTFSVNRVYEEIESALAENPNGHVVIYCVPEYTVPLANTIINRLQLRGSVYSVKTNELVAD